MGVCKKHPFADCKVNHHDPQYLGSNAKNNPKNNPKDGAKRAAAIALGLSMYTRTGAGGWSNTDFFRKGGTQEQLEQILERTKKSEAKAIKFELEIKLIPLDNRRQWHRGDPRPQQGGGERSLGTNPVGAKLEREKKGLEQLLVLYPAPYQIEDCRNYEKQVGCDVRIWLEKSLKYRVDIKSGNVITKAQQAVALSSAEDAVTYFIFDPVTGQAMPINKDCEFEPVAFKVYAPKAVAATV